MINMKVEALGARGRVLVSAPVRTPKACFSLNVPLMCMFQIGNFDSPSSMRHTDHWSWLSFWQWMQLASQGSLVVH